jgi:riboflavin kinase/FMN adenylyltransferase
MQFLRSLTQIPQDIGDTIVTIGSYDGIHLGHQKIIQKLISDAKQQSLSSVVISFDPYPKEFFLGERVPRLMSWREKFLALQELSIDYFLLIRFNKAFSEMSAEDFIKQVLVNKLHIKRAIIGDDFRFGKGRKGDYKLLSQMGDTYDFSVEHSPTYEYLNERISSSRIRHTLQAGNMDIGRDLLGHYYYLWGTVIHGDKVGRKLGFPTANIDLHRRLVPLHGIYVVRVSGIDGTDYFGVANIGNRPAVGGSHVLLEVFIFDFNKTIYGLNIKVEFLYRLRDEENYETLDLLKEQIACDVKTAKDWLFKESQL